MIKHIYIVWLSFGNWMYYKQIIKLFYAMKILQIGITITSTFYFMPGSSWNKAMSEGVGDKISGNTIFCR